MTEIRDRALAVIDQAPEEVKGYLLALEKKDVVALGIDEAFVLRDSEGQIKAFKQTVHLSLQNGGLIQPVYNGPSVVSAQGYEIINEATGASVIFPKTVLVDGEEKPNPFVVREKGHITQIICRAVAFKYSSKGIPMTRDWTTVYDVRKYRAADLFAKAKKFPQAFMALPADMKPSDLDLDIKGPQAWAKTEINDEVNLWYNTRHPECLDWLKHIINREKKVLDYAQTFAARNAAKHLHGIQRPPGQIGQNGNTVPVPAWTFTVLCWRPVGQNIIKWDTAQYEALQGRVDRMLKGENEFKGQHLDYKAGSEEIDQEAYADPTVMEPEDGPAQIEVQEFEGPEGADEPNEAPDDSESVSGPKLDYVTQVSSIRDDPELNRFFLEACDALKIDPKAELSQEQAEALFQGISNSIDQADKEG